MIMIKDKITLMLSKEQAYSLMAACELYSRVHMGQFDWISYQFVGSKYTTIWKDSDKHDEVNELMDKARGIIFPDLGESKSRSYGIMSKEVSESARNVWDIYQSIRYTVTSNADRPFQTAVQSLPTVTVEKIKED
jgi:hypothetical protein